jgi:hypothetical protein
VKLIEGNADCQSWAYLPIAAVAVRAADRTAYADICGTMLQRFADSENIEDAERVTKACLLWPGVFDISTLPADKFTKALDDGTASDGFKPWGWAARALLAYRSGNPDAAVDYVARSEESAPGEFTQAMNLPVLALAQHQLQKTDEARATLEESSQLITRLKDDPGKKGDAKLVIAEILFVEATAKINGNEASEEERSSTSELKPTTTPKDD